MSSSAELRWIPLRRVAAGPAVREEAFDVGDFEPTLWTRLLILQPTPFCNIDCSYCYLPQRNSKARMSLATIQLAVRRLVDDGLLGEQLTIVWHAGEPLTVPPAYYEDAFGFIAQELTGRTEVLHSIQTNATLIDDAWCDLFARHGVRVGVSVDGPADLHDAHRRTRSGKGTHAAAILGMQCLRQHGLPFHAIAVVTAATLNQADSFVDFFERQGVQDLGCNFDEIEGGHTHSSLALQEAGHQRFIGHLLDRSLASPGSLRVRELGHAFHSIAHGLPKYQWRGRSWPENAQTVPFELLSVACNGDFSSFSPELLGQRSPAYGDFRLGNVHQQGYLAAAGSPAFVRLWQAIRQGVSACERECAHFNYCGGGAPVNKLYENGDLGSTETLYCRTMVKRPFDAVLHRIERDRDAAPEREPRSRVTPTSNRTLTGA